MAHYALTECPSWTAGLGPQGEITVQRREPDWLRTHMHPTCLRCGQIISEELGCPAIKDPQTAMVELIRMEAPETLHVEA